MASKKKTTRYKPLVEYETTAVSKLLYDYAMLKPEEQRNFNRKLRVFRDNSGMIADLVALWRKSTTAAATG